MLAHTSVNECHVDITDGRLSSRGQFTVDSRSATQLGDIYGEEGGRERERESFRDPCDVLYLELSPALQLCAISVSVPKTSFSTDVKPASTHRLAMATCNAFRRAISALSIFTKSRTEGCGSSRISNIRSRIR